MDLFLHSVKCGIIRAANPTYPVYAVNDDPVGEKFIIGDTKNKRLTKP